MTRAILIFFAITFFLLAALGIYIAKSHYAPGSNQGAGYIRLAIFETAVALILLSFAFRRVAYVVVGLVVGIVFCLAFGVGI